MWLKRLSDLQLIDSAAYAMGCFIQQHTASNSPWPGVLCALSMQAIKNGHTCLDCNRLTEQFPELNKIPEFLLHCDARTLVDCPFIGTENIHTKTLFTYLPPYLFTNKFLDLEQRLIENLAERLNEHHAQQHDSNEHLLAELCYIKPLTLLSGGPGTGKTTVFARAIPHWISRFQQGQQRTPNIILCAPTGKAAARMSEAWMANKMQLMQTCDASFLQDALPEQAFTIHRLLAINPVSKIAKYNKRHTLSVDLLIIDEASMLDLPLFVQLLEALPQSAHLLCIGDAQQLPAIEAGNILGSLLDAQSNHWFFQQLQSAHLHLTQNFRQKSTPGLSKLAGDCLQEPAETVFNHLENNDYAMVSWSADHHPQLKQLITRAVAHYAALTQCKQVDQALAAVRHFVILTAVRQGPNGCVAINAEIAQHLNPRHLRYYHGQLLLITENAPHLHLANGDIVMIWQQDDLSLKAYFTQDGVVQMLDLDILPAHEPAYALTIHKAQGSEYDNVSVVLPSQDSPILNKALLYTGITRAKQQLQIISSKESLLLSLRKTVERVNGLQRIAEQLMQNKIQ